MKLFEKIMRFIRGADRAVTDAICERLDNTAEKLENFARNLDPEAFQESKMRESWEGRPKTDPETAARLAQMPVASLEDAIDQNTGERCDGYRESAPAEIAIEQTGRMRIKHCMNGTTWTAHVQPWTNTRSRRRRRENNG